MVFTDLPGYRALRQLVTGEKGVQTLARAGSDLMPVCQVLADPYGIRTLLRAGDAEIKLEIVHEGRIELSAPGPKDRICGITALTPLDMATTKLPANSDCWADDSVFSQDLIDLAMLTPSRTELTRAIEKAACAYGQSIQRDLDRAIRRLGDRPGRLDECMEALKIDRVPKALLWKRIRSLKPRNFS